MTDSMEYAAKRADKARRENRVENEIETIALELAHKEGIQIENLFSESALLELRVRLDTGSLNQITFDLLASIIEYKKGNLDEAIDLAKAALEIGQDDALALSLTFLLASANSADSNKKFVERIEQDKMVQVIENYTRKNEQSSGREIFDRYFLELLQDGAGDEAILVVRALSKLVGKKVVRRLLSDAKQWNNEDEKLVHRITSLIQLI